MANVFLFPGQNSRYPGMIAKFASIHPDNARILTRASDVLHRDIRLQFDVENAAAFDRNRDVQLGVFLASHLALASLQRTGIDADCSLGFSLGEYNHLVHIGVLDFDDALRLLTARGDAYDRAPQGAMASVFPIRVEDLEDVVSRCERRDEISIALHNSPTQQVLSGTAEAIAEAGAHLDDLNVSVVVFEHRLAMHSPLMNRAAVQFQAALQRTAWGQPRLPYLPNVSGTWMRSPNAAQLVDHLTRHIVEPVLWCESITRVRESICDPTFIEVGPGRVLHDLLGRRWFPCRRFRTDPGPNLLPALEHLAEELTVGC